MTSEEVAERLLRAASSAASPETNEENQFLSLISATRRNFRRPLKEVSSRGRKRKSSFTRKVFLMKLSNADFLPGNAEQHFLKLRGLGEATELFHVKRSWTMAEIKENIKQLYAPHVQNLLHMSDFTLAKSDRSKRLIFLDHSLNGEDLEKKLGASKITIVPLKDFPNDLPIVEHPRSEIAGTALVTTLNNTPTQTQQTRLSRQLSLRRVEQQRQHQDSDSDEFDFTDLNPHLELRSDAEGVSDLDADPAHDFFILPTLGEDAESLSVDIDRNNCMHEVFSLYGNESLLEKKLSVTFKNELGVDGGGLTKEMFNVFFKELEGVYLRGENCLVPFLELNNMEKKDDFVLIGRVLIHMLLLTGSIPSKLSRVTLLLLGKPEGDIDSNILLQDLMNYVNPCLRSVIKKVLNDFQNLKIKEKEMLQAFFQSVKYLALPNGEKIREQLLTIAVDIFVDKPRRLIEKLRLGVCIQKYESFWTKCDFSVLLDMQKVTANKVVNCLAYETHLTNEESDVAHYFEMYIRCLSTEHLERLVFLITGSFLMPLIINVRFSDLVGLAMRPTFSTCTDTIVLPKTYTSYEELKNQLNICLISEEAKVYSTY